MAKQIIHIKVPCGLHRLKSIYLSRHIAGNQPLVRDALTKHMHPRCLNILWCRFSPFRFWGVNLIFKINVCGLVLVYRLQFSTWIKWDRLKSNSHYKMQLDVLKYSWDTHAWSFLMVTNTVKYMNISKSMNITLWNHILFFQHSVLNNER